MGVKKVKTEMEGRYRDVQMMQNSVCVTTSRLRKNALSLQSPSALSSTENNKL